MFTSKKFPSALFFINFSFLLLFAFQIYYTFGYLILRSQPFLNDLFIMAGEILFIILVALGIPVRSAIAVYFLKLSTMTFLEEKIWNL